MRSRQTPMTMSAAPEELARCRDALVSADTSLYWRYNAGQFLISPADETPHPPCDVQPDDEDVAVAIARFQEQVDVQLANTRPRAWAGLRTFAPDNKPIVGFEPGDRPFFWLCGQGGYGIQTADAMATLAASLLLDGAIPANLRALGLCTEDITPARRRCNGYLHPRRVR